jgi:TPR repeat protein
MKPSDESPGGYLDADALIALGDRSERSAQDPISFERAAQFYRQAVRLGSAEAMTRLSQLLLANSRSIRTTRFAVKLAYRAARSGYAGAVAQLALTCVHGNQMNQARRWLSKLPHKFHAVGTVPVLKRILAEHFGSMSARELLKSLGELAESNDEAMWCLAFLSILGKDEVPPKPRHAKRLMYRLDANVNIGYLKGLYELRWGGSKSRAAKLMEPAAEAGYLDACMFVGWYAAHRGQKVSSSTRRYLEQAAAFGFEPARHLLGVRKPLRKGDPRPESTALLLANMPPVVTRLRRWVAISFLTMWLVWFGCLLYQALT